LKVAYYRALLHAIGKPGMAMYDKGEKEDLSEFKETEYWEAVQNFQN
jgi:hypothetical protein